MTITNTSTPEELQEKLKTALTEFMEKNKQFNVQCSHTDDDGITANALIDFGIEDRDKDNYHVASVSVRLDSEENLKVLEDKGLIDEETPVDEVDNEKLYHLFGESDAMMDLESAITSAIRSVFNVGPRHNLQLETMKSDIDINTTIPIMFGEWSTKESVDFTRE